MTVSRKCRTVKTNRFGSAASLMLAGCCGLGLTGCTTTPGARTSIWPTKTVDGTNPSAFGAKGAFASTTKAVQGQFASMGTAVSSVYGKTKSAITAPFTGGSSTPDSNGASSLSNTTTVGPELHVMSGQMHEYKGDYTKALDSYSKALEQDPKNAAALLSTARLYERQNKKDKAIEFYQKASAVDEGNASIYADLGNLQAKNGNLVAAREQLQKAINLDDKNTTYRSAMAGVLLDSGNADAALAELHQANSPAMANYQMAYLHFARKNIPATQQYLNSALKIDPNLKPARDLLVSTGGVQNINQMAQQGQQTLQQAQGIYQQAGAIGNNLQGLLNSQPTTQPPPSSNGLPPVSDVSQSSFQSPPYENAYAPSQTIRR